MIGKLFKSVTPETYILIFNASLVSLYGINVGVQQLLNLRENQESDGPKHTSVGDHFKQRGSQLANVSSCTDINNNNNNNNNNIINNNNNNNNNYEYINSRDYQDISTFMKEYCFDVAGPKIKDEKAVESFCGFINHLLDHDYNTILSNYMESNKNLNIIKLSLDDVIKQKFYKKVDKDHYLEDIFLNSLKSAVINLNKRVKDEL